MALSHVVSEIFNVEKYRDHDYEISVKSIYLLNERIKVVQCQWLLGSPYKKNENDIATSDNLGINTR